MSTTFDTGFSNGDLIAPNHVSQFAQPTNDLESGAALYREAANVSGVYEVDFQPSANPDAHFIEELTPGQVIVFKASHNSPANAELKVLVDGGTETHPLFLEGEAVAAGEIVADQIVMVVFNDTTTPRFDIVGGGGTLALGQIADVEIDSPTTGQVLRYDGDEFVNATLEMEDVDGLLAAIATAGGTLGGHLAELQGLTLAEGDILTVDSGGELIKLAAGDEGEVLKIVSGVPAWGELVGGGGGDWLVTGLVAYGSRYAEITSTSDNLTSSAFTPVAGRQYLIRWLANHSNSVDQLNLASAITNGQPHFCRAKETGSSTLHNIGFSGGGALAYTCTEAQRTRTHEFVWTATTSNEVQIQLGQPSLTYGEFTGTLLVYEVQSGAINLGFGTFGSGYRWLNDATVTATSLSGGSYKSGVSLDSSKTYALIGSWCQGYSVNLILRQGSTYWRLSATGDTLTSASGSDNTYTGGTYYENTTAGYRGEINRIFTPPSTGTFEVGCPLYNIQSGCFWLVELP